jgi:hypothetical protein
MLRTSALLLFASLATTIACGESPAPQPGAGNTGTSGKGGGSAGTAPGGAGGGSAGQLGSGGSAGSSGGTTPTAGAGGGSAGTSAGSAGTAGSAGGAGAGSGGQAGRSGAGGAAAGTGGSVGGAGSGAGGGTAGSGGAAGGVGGGSSGGGSGGGSTALVSDDFEGASLDAGKWVMGGTGQGTIAISTEQKHGGAQSVKVTGMTGPTYFFNRSVFPLPNGVVHFRVWMQFANADWANHVAFVAASPGMESQEVRFGGQANAYHANLAADGDGLSPNPFEQPSCALCLEPVANQWACLRGKFDFTNSDAELYVGDTLAVDAKEKADWHSGNGVLPQNPTQIGFGWALYGGPMNTVYYDDIAIGYEPIPCQ